MPDNDTHIVRRNLAYFWSVVGAGFLFYASVKWGANHPEIQTLLIGFILGGGVVGMIVGTYFSYNPSKPNVTQNADTISNSPAVGGSDASTDGTGNGAESAKTE